MRIDNIINQLVLGVKKMIEQRKLYVATNDSVVTYPIQILIRGRNSSIASIEWVDELTVHTVSIKSYKYLFLQNTWAFQ